MFENKSHFFRIIFFFFKFLVTDSKVEALFYITQSVVRESAHVLDG